MSGVWNSVGMCVGIRRFFGILTLHLYTEIYGANGLCFGIQIDMTVFDWYTTGILHPGILIATFFLFCDLWKVSGLSLHLKNDSITFTGFVEILNSKWVKRGMSLVFEIPLSKELLNFSLEYFKDEVHMDISYFELIKYQGFN